MRILRKPHPAAMFLAWFLMVFLVLFPKGGVKLGGLPLTWGYMALAFTTPVLLVVRIVAFPFRLPIRAWLALLMLLPIQLLCVYSVVFFGLVEASFAVSTLSAFFFLPWIFLLVYPPFLASIDGDRLALYFRRCILFAALWGIFLFFWHPLTGHFIEIPLLTVNSDDAGQLETTKHIARGLFLKLISTYNNGNLYGVDTLILLPLYDYFEPSRWRRYAVKLALLLTLSRTVWAGMVVFEAMPLLLLLLRQASTFPRLHLGQARRRVMALVVTVAMIFAALAFNSSNLSFLLDPTFGNRLGLLSDFFNGSLLPTHGLFGFSEILYGSAVREFGYAGLIAFTLLMLSPLLLLFVDHAKLSPIRRAALKGLVLYSILAGVDGGFNFIPTMAFYWFAYMVFLFGWPRPHAALALAQVSPRRSPPNPFAEAAL